MPKNSIVLALLACAGFLAACEPIVRMRGRVTEKMPVESTAPTEPIEGATVQLYCPADNKDADWTTYFDSMETDATGHFADDEIGGPSLDCEFRASRDGYRNASVTLEEVCTSVHREKYCYETKADIQMEPVD